MGAYFGMELNTMAAMLNGQRAEPWHASADIWGSTCQQLLSTHGDLAAANGVITSWPQSIGSVAQTVFSGQVIGSHASLAEWSVYTGAMSAALRLGGTALNLAQAVMPALQSGYNTAVALSGVPFIGPIAAQVAATLNVAGAGMMEAVGTVMQAPTAVPPPAQGWQGPGGSLSPMPSSPVPSVDLSKVLDAADKIVGLAEKGLTLTQTVAGMAQSAGLGKELENLGDLPQTLPQTNLPSLAGGLSISPPSLNPVGGGDLHLPSTVGSPLNPAVATSLGALPAIASLRGGPVLATRPVAVAVTPSATVAGARIAPGTEPSLAGGTSRTTTAATTKPTPTITPPPAHGAGASHNESRSSRRRTPADRATDQTEELRRNGVQPDLQGRAAHDPLNHFGLPPARRRKPTTPDDTPLDNELFLPDSTRPE